MTTYDLNPAPFDPTDGTLRPLASYTDRIPSSRRGRKLNRATLWRWALSGARGGRVRLRTSVIGGGRFTSDAAVANFMRELESARQHERPAKAAANIEPARLADIQQRFAEAATDPRRSVPARGAPERADTGAGNASQES
jgi:hypothetical protein